MPRRLYHDLFRVNFGELTRIAFGVNIVSTTYATGELSKKSRARFKEELGLEVTSDPSFTVPSSCRDGSLASSPQTPKGRDSVISVNYFFFELSLPVVSWRCERNEWIARSLGCKPQALYFCRPTLGAGQISMANGSPGRISAPRLCLSPTNHLL